MSIQRIFANDTNAVLRATITASKVLPSSSVWQRSAARSGNGTVSLGGQYVGSDDALFELEITGQAGQGRTSTPVFSGQGSGSISNVLAGTLDPQKVRITLKDMGITTAAASVDFFGATLKAKVAGTPGNAINITVDRSGITTAAASWSTFKEIQQGQSNLSGPESNFGAMVLTGTGEMNPASLRLVFGDDPQVFRQYKRFVSNDWEYVLTPATPRYIKAGTPVATISGTYTVTITDGSAVETYANIVTLYDLLSAVAAQSALVEVIGAVTKDLQPGGMATLDLPLRTDAYHLPVVKSGKYCTELLNLLVGPCAPTEMLSIECVDNSILGSEIWRVSGTASGVIAQAQTGISYRGKDYQFEIPARMPDVVTSPRVKNPGAINISSTAFAARKDTEQTPELGIKMGALGKAGFSGSLTATWTKYTKTAECNWEDAIISGGLSDTCLGFDNGTTGGADVALDPAYQSRLQALYEWRKEFVVRNSQRHLIQDAVPETPYQPAMPEQLAVAEIPYRPEVPYQPAMPEQLAVAEHTATKITPYVSMVIKKAFSITLTIDIPIVTNDYALFYRMTHDQAIDGTKLSLAQTLEHVSEGSTGLAEFSAISRIPGASAMVFAFEGAEPTPGSYSITGTITLQSNGTNVIYSSYLLGSFDILADSQAAYTAFIAPLATMITDGKITMSVNHVPTTVTVPAVPYRAATPEIPYQPAQAYVPAVPYRAATPEVPYQPGSPAVMTAFYMANADLAWLSPFFGLLVSTLSQIYTVPASLALWDDLKDSILDDMDAFDKTMAEDISLNAQQVNGVMMPGDDANYIERYKAEVDLILLAAGIVPGKSDGSSGGTGCWSDMKTDYWKLDGDYLPFYNNVIGYSTKRDAEGTPYNTYEFGFAIACKCPNLLKHGDKITISFAGSTSTASSPRTYQPGDSFQVPVIAGMPLSLTGGVNGNDTVTWGVTGGIVGDLDDYQVVGSNPTTYLDSSSGFSFNLALGGIPFALGDSFSLDVEGGTFRWRKDGTAWSADLPIANTLLSDGLTAVFSAGAAPSFVPGDFFAFDAKQPATPANIKNPLHNRLWQFIGDGSATIALQASTPITSLCIVHDLPVGTEIGIDPPLFGHDTITTTGDVISIIEGDETAVDEVTITVTPPQGTETCTLAFVYLGQPLSTEYAPDEIKLARRWDLLHGSKSNFGGVFIAKGVSGQFAWRSFISKAEVDAHIAMIDHVKRNGDEPIIVLPHHLHPEEAFMCRVSTDQVEITDMMQFQPNEADKRILALTLPFEPVMQ